MGGKLKKTLAGLGFAVLGLAVCCAVYAVGVVIAARAQTPALIRAARQSVQPWCRLSELSPWQIQALLAVEDPDFYGHHGIDLHTPGAGLTTITQGLAKKLYFHPFKPGIRKLKLMLLARMVVDPLVPKDEQLELFINLMFLGRAGGRPVIGFGEAARVYYGRPLSRLSEAEYLSLVAMVIAPVNFHVRDRPQANAERTARLAKVVSGEYRPQGLMDLFYGPLDAETQKGLAPASYFPGAHRKETE